MTEAPEKETSTVKKPSAALQYIQNEIKAPAGQRVIIKQLTPHWFRVRWLAVIKDDNHVLTREKEVASKVFEVIENPWDYDLVDRTVVDKPSTRF